jgi:HK97 family phage major capsid protein
MPRSFFEVRSELDALRHAQRQDEDEARGVQIAELEQEAGQALAELAANPEAREDGASFHNYDTRDREPVDNLAPHVRQGRDEGLRAIERSDVSAAAGDRLTDLVERDRTGSDGRYLAAVSNPDYERAFWKRMEHGSEAVFHMTDREAEAMRRVVAAEQERAMSVGTPSAGGMAVPYALDPSIILTSDGSANPLRELATVTTITTSEWRGVSSAGVTATFAAEATEVGDNSPTLAQPTIIPEKAQAFIPYSIELGMDWGGIQEELGRLLADAKDQLEASKFTLGVGHGSFEPEGLIVGATTVTTTVGTGLFAVADIYATQQALPPRYSPNATWLSSNTIANTIYRFVGGASTEPPLFNESRNTLLGKPWREVSHIVSTTSTGSLPLAYGDVRAGFRIVDRVGLSVELIPHLFATANNRPSGQRGLYAYWRTSSEVVNANAFRVTKVK